MFLFPDSWQSWVALLVFVVDVAASLHVVLHKRDSRSAIGWVGLIWLAPVAGVVLYALLGLNRIRRTAMELQRERQRFISGNTAEQPAWLAGVSDRRFQGLARLSRQLSNRPLLGGNGVEPLQNGDEAYPAMLDAIRSAKHTVSLCSYIFADDAAGKEFVAALADAVRRGVQVRVLIDDVGVRYSFPPVHWALQRAGVRVARFLPIISRTGLAFLNLRTHRKLLVVDGRVAFAGGMNIAAANLNATAGRRAIRDIHFRLEGPVVRQLQDAFAEDWAFTTREILDGDGWFPDVENRGDVSARVITNGPDRDFEVMRNVLIGALSSARESVRIVTPYFIPDPQLTAALAVCALRGVTVDILLPQKGNIRLAEWACRATLWQVLEPGCRVFLSPPPFEHTKLFVVDRTWALFGTTNWDARSLRLNFELDVECYDRDLATRLDAVIAQRIGISRQYTLRDADGRGVFSRVRDGVARLWSPYL
ncbi:MAG TPA: cardiolipin synthase [Gemmatimonadaceae bacterium]|nr:cardiolipin synthase [Gemmatimonadaceae bacterium]